MQDQALNNASNIHGSAKTEKHSTSLCSSTKMSMKSKCFSKANLKQIKIMHLIVQESHLFLSLALGMSLPHLFAEPTFMRNSKN
jgi:hypothetical protein